jgi:hypothetical protein
MISAFLPLAAVVFLYVSGLLPNGLLHAMDVRYFKIKDRTQNHLGSMFIDIIKSFGDQQIVTGNALLVAGFLQFRTITVNHWLIVVSLAWMSAEVHLACLTVLKGTFKRRTFRSLWRLVGMLTLVIMLFAAIVPVAFQMPPNLGCSAVADIRRELLITSQATSVLSGVCYIILLSLYIWKISQLCNSTTTIVWKWTRAVPARLLERMMRKYSALHKQGNNYCRTLQYRSVVAAYILLVSFSDIASSFAASLWVLIMNFALATVTLISVRINAETKRKIDVTGFNKTAEWYLARGNSNSTDQTILEMAKWWNTTIHYAWDPVQRDVEKSEDEWGFGQLVPLFLLIIPLCTSVEIFLSRSQNRWPNCMTNAHIEFKKKRTTQDAIGWSHGLSDDPEKFKANVTCSEITEGSEVSVRLDQPFSEIVSIPPKEVCFATHIRLDNYHEYLYSSRLFKLMLSTIIFFAVGCGVVLCSLVVLLLRDFDSPFGNSKMLWVEIFAPFFALAITLAVELFIGMFFSRVFK